MLIPVSRRSYGVACRWAAPSHSTDLGGEPQLERRHQLQARHALQVLQELQGQSGILAETSNSVEYMLDQFHGQATLGLQEVGRLASKLRVHAPKPHGCTKQTCCIFGTVFRNAGPEEAVIGTSVGTNAL
mmetsp:Transcript_48418/g.88813  ORF Transcript_48418/g.88813 Transcript_48418/m.88813 type:complete len:130 (+) Transcript_48418:22-411(+)